MIKVVIFLLLIVVVRSVFSAIRLQQRKGQSGKFESMSLRHLNDEKVMVVNHRPPASQEVVPRKEKVAVG